MNTPHKSISVLPIDNELPMLSVITGANGSGKSHFLESIAEYKIQFSGQIGAPRMLGISELQSVEQFSTISETREQTIETLKMHVRSQGARIGIGEQGDEIVRQVLIGNNIVNATAIQTAERNARKPISRWNDQDFQLHTPMEIGQRDLFQFSVASTFASYNQMRTANDFKEYRASKFGEDLDWLERADFEKHYGEAPWVVLNRVLDNVGLPYQFEAPEPSMTGPYQDPRLTDSATQRPVATQELSSGEKTLLTIAMSIYSADKRRDLVTMPSILLLDEPDATLHPSMVRSMLALVRDEIVGKLGIPVILSTHSPTTIALAEEQSIFIMSRDGHPRLRKASQDEALSSLLIGVPALSVRAENRRVVIVESPNDERIYTRVMALLGSRVSHERSLQFMAAGSKDLPNGCDAVVRLVKGMRTNGNSLVWGLVDRDDRVVEPDSHIFFNPQRYSIENVVLDPLSLGLFLLRSRDNRMLESLAPIDYLNFQPGDTQSVVDVTVAILETEGDDKDTEYVLYFGGQSSVVPKFVLNGNGHDLEERVLKEFPALKRFQGKLLDEIISSVWAERPEVVPSSATDLFARLLNAE